MATMYNSIHANGDITITVTPSTIRDTGSTTRDIVISDDNGRIATIMLFTHRDNAAPANIVVYDDDA